MTWDEAIQPVVRQGTVEASFLAIHGFTSTPGSVTPWGLGVHEATGAHLEVPLLPGHGTRWEDLNRVTWQQWADASLEAYDRLAARGHPVVVGGLSLGGLIACHVALERPAAGLVLINHLMWLSNPALALAPFLKRVLPSVAAIAGDVAKPDVQEQAYRRVPTGGVDQFRRMMKAVRRRLPEITVPALLFKSRQDHVIPLSSTRKTWERIGSSSKELVWLERSYHVASLDYDLPVLIDRTAEWIRSVALSTSTTMPTGRSPSR